ncbi:MAG: HIT family protein [Patescibacteria group bacterium]
MAKSIFEKIIDREIPAYIVWEDDEHLAFLDIMPIQKGHTLLIPKKPIDYIFDMQDESYIKLMKASKKVAEILKKATGAYKIGMIVEGLEVPHVHVKLVPIDHTHSLSQSPSGPATQEELKETQQQILKVQN